MEGRKVIRSGSGTVYQLSVELCIWRVWRVWHV